MKLLFKDTGFSKDFRELLGFVDGSFLFITMKPEIISATRDLIEVIGQDLYDHVYDIFNQELPDNENLPLQDQELLYHVKYPLALNAYRLSAPTRDLSHTKNGRLMRVAENEKQAFEWMINRDDINQERKYYRAIDDLLKYLDNENVENWKQSTSYKKLNKRFVSRTEDFDDSFPISSRLLLIKLTPGLKKAEYDHILPLVGKDLFEQLHHDKLAGEIPEEYQVLFKKIQDACVYFSLAWAMKRLTVTLFPEGILQSFTSDRVNARAKKVPEQMQTQLAEQEFNKDAQKTFREIESIITKKKPSVATPSEEDINFNFDFDSDDSFATT